MTNQLGSLTGGQGCASGSSLSPACEATGQSARFLKIYDEFKKAPEVTRERMYLETMERVFGGTDKIIIDSGTQNGVVPYLPLNELTRRPQTQPQNPPQNPLQNPPQAGGNR